MRLKAPRIEPLSDTDLDSGQADNIRKTFPVGPIYNIFRTLMRAPRASKAFLAWGGYILSDHNDLPPRERELIILRTGYNWKSGYEWAQHVRIGQQAGLTDEEIARIKQGPDAKGWNSLDRALLQAADELTADSFVTDATWAELSDLSEKQRMDLVMTVGQYTQVSMMLNSFGVQLDEGLQADPDLEA
ncbi:MAG: carboxymuconolactone decarboxylase family protein [Pseudomonadota bacterium]